MNKKMAMSIGAVALAGVVGTGIYHTEASSSNEEQVQVVEDTTSLTMEEAAKQLEEEYQGTVKEIELDKENNKSYYEAEIIADNQEYDVDMDAASGEVVKEEMEERDYDDRNPKSDQQNASTENENQADKSNLITQEEATNAAKQEFDGDVVEMELDHDDGRYVYEFELVNGQQEADIEVDAETSDILSLEVEKEDDDD